MTRTLLIALALLALAATPVYAMPHSDYYVTDKWDVHATIIAVSKPYNEICTVFFSNGAHTNGSGAMCKWRRGQSVTLRMERLYRCEIVQNIFGYRYEQRRPVGRAYLAYVR